MIRAGFTAPPKVVRVALQTAASVAGVMLTTNVRVTEKKKDGPKVAGAVA